MDCDFIYVSWCHILYKLPVYEDIFGFADKSL
jgi:hypothetical protein